MDRSHLAVLTAVALGLSAAAAYAGPCTEQIAQFEHQLRSRARTPSAPQSVGAQLHHQPTPQMIENAETRAGAAAAAGLERARKADAEGDADACRRALEGAKQLYSVN